MWLSNYLNSDTIIEREKKKLSKIVFQNILRKLPFLSSLLTGYPTGDSRWPRRAISPPSLIT